MHETNEIIKEEHEDDSRTQTSKQSESNPPFKFMKCKNPVGRPAGTQQSATSFGKKIKRKSHKFLENLPKVQKLISSAITKKISKTTTVLTQESDNSTTTTTTTTNFCSGT